MVLVELKYSGPGTSVKLSNGDFRKLKDGIVFLAPTSDAFQLVKSESFQYNGKEEKKSVQVQNKVDEEKPEESTVKEDKPAEKEKETVDSTEGSGENKHKTRRGRKK